VEREKPLRDDGAQLTHKFALFQLFATCAIDSIVTVLGQEEALTPECPLSARELEVLQWTLAGKTAWEVGAILGISQGTAAQYVNHAARKLGAVNKHQAALKALRLGWIR
jgi:DNA-binding CsgD family transcriptional regulator